MAAVSTAAIQEMRNVSEMIVDDISRNVHSALALNDLANADGYTLKHSLAVTTLGLSLGLRVMRKYGWTDAHGVRRFDSIEDRLTALGVGLLLHDVGKLAVPAEILRKAGPLTPEEWQAMRAHPTLGFQMASVRWRAPSSDRTTNGGTAPATPTASPARRFISSPGSPRSRMCSTPSHRIGSIAAHCRCTRDTISSSRAPGSTSILKSSKCSGRS
jgi:hypothetical protein